MISSVEVTWSARRPLSDRELLTLSRAPRHRRPHRHRCL